MPERSESKISLCVAEVDEESSLVSREISRPPSYGALSTGPPLAHPSVQAEPVVSQDGKRRSKTVIKRSTMACLLLQHTSSALANGIDRFAMFIVMVELFKDTLAPASFVSLVTAGAGIMFSGKIGGIIDNVPRLTFVRSAVGAQKCTIIISFALFLVLFGPLEGLPARVFHETSTTTEKVQVGGFLLLTALIQSATWLANVGIDVAVGRDWVTTIAQGDSQCLTTLNAYITSIDLLSRIAGPMIVSAFTACMSYPAALKCLIGLIAVCGVLELFWIQVVYDRFPVLREDEIRRGRGIIHLPLDTDGSDGSADSHASAGGQKTIAQGSWRDEIAVWREFIQLPVFFSSLAQSMTWLTSLHFDATGVAHFKMSAGYSDFFLACARSLCMISCLVGTAVMPRIERRFGLAKTGVMGLSFGVLCFIGCTITFFLEPVLRHASSDARLVNTAVMFGGIIFARLGHINFDLAQAKSLQLDLEAHPRRNRMAALQPSLQAVFNLCKQVTTMTFSTQATYKWTVLITLIANFGALASYLNFLRLKRKQC